MIALTIETASFLSFGPVFGEQKNIVKSVLKRPN